jgi:hypothetical protein
LRYYRLEFQRPDGSPIEFSSFGSSASLLPLSPGASVEKGVITSLFPNGSTNPAALNIEVDIEQMAMHLGDASSYVRIYGLALADIFKKDLNPGKDGNNKIKISLGMAKGLPLANDAQRGLVIDASIQQAFGNWIGTDMTLDIVIGPGGVGSPAAPSNFVLNWQKGQKLSEALEETFKNSPMSELKRKITISDDRVSDTDWMPGFYTTLVQLAQSIQVMTRARRGDDDPGVYIYVNGQDLLVAEAKETGSQSIEKEIAFRDLIGQVTWFAPTQLSCKLVMRGDLNVLSIVKFPQGAAVQTQAGAMSGIVPSIDKNSVGIASGGKFQVMRIHHWGNYRQPDAMAWNTTIGLTPFVTGS